jgi:hypothetical protein
LVDGNIAKAPGGRQLERFVTQKRPLLSGLKPDLSLLVPWGFSWGFP